MPVTAAQIAHILQLPYVTFSQNAPLTRDFTTDPVCTPHTYDGFKEMVKGNMQLPRLTALHRLSAKDKNPLRVIDNGPGTSPHLSVVATELNAEVIVKEPWSSALRFHRRQIDSNSTAQRMLGRDRLSHGGRILYAQDLPGGVHGIHPADIVYWTNPDFERLEIPEGSKMLDYMSRDVMLGGFLVVQSDHFLENEFWQLFKGCFKRTPGWHTIFSEDIGDLPVIPTAQLACLHLQIYQKNF